ncbi:AbrB family looped-hinge helix DNA binding protein [Cytobacillus purgationiresistens]|uniref:AbrB family looped-hinge helix DNA binding protein n=1 Tax=Cytobacillus purgationiresistens TaxID=863449 RepID=A0ABU0AJ23_9BACI|nr:AbrB family looped-hinge helix DNA binding protein [Cytobacillus purgationiresistens]
MKGTGIVRKVDELGRIVIPKELRRTLDINEKDSLEIFVKLLHLICTPILFYFNISNFSLTRANEIM